MHCFLAKDSFTRTLDVTVFVSGTFDLFDVMCKQHQKAALDPFLNGTKNGDIDGTCKRGLKFSWSYFGTCELRNAS